MSATQDSRELEDLFDSVARTVPPAAPVAPGGGAGADDVVTRVGKLTRQFHDTLCELGLDKALQGAAQAMPDTRDRLAYVARMTEDAAARTLCAVESARPVQEALAAGADELHARWQRLKRGELDVDAFKQLAEDNQAYLKKLPEQTRATSERLHDIMMAQEFQDLTGQVIKKITLVVSTLEQQLLTLLLDNVPAGRRQEASGLLTGPVQAAARAHLEREAGELSHGASVTVTLGRMDERLTLPPCASLSAFTPSGARAWGHTTVGLRCASPVPWQIQLTAHVAVHGTWLAAARALPAGQPLGAADFALQAGDLTQFAAGVATQPEQALNKVLASGVAAGQALRLDLLRAPLAIRQGQSVRVVTQGPGFRVSAEGHALANASDGQALAVRMSSGVTVSGIARAHGVVEVRL
jgi:chemotaxis protein CheZ